VKPDVAVKRGDFKDNFNRQRRIGIRNAAARESLRLTFRHTFLLSLWAEYQ
jgi:hypothetical protein